MGDGLRSGDLEEAVLEVVEVPEDGTTIHGGNGEADGEVEADGGLVVKETQSVHGLG